MTDPIEKEPEAPPLNVDKTPEPLEAHEPPPTIPELLEVMPRA